MSHELPDETIKLLGSAAWSVRERARVHGKTRVGCAAFDEEGRLYTGCNMEHRFRSHDVHAEVSTISSLVSGGGKSLVAIFIAAERQRFTPCGACLDWIFEVGGEDCIVLNQGIQEGPTLQHTAAELMPFYPR